MNRYILATAAFLLSCSAFLPSHVLAQRPPRWFIPVVVCAVLALALSVIESGAMVWVTAICCAAAGMPGIKRSTVVATTVMFAAYLVLRHALGIVSLVNEAELVIKPKCDVLVEHLIGVAKARIE